MTASRDRDGEIDIIIVEDNPSDAELVQRELRKAGLTFTARIARDKAAFLACLDESAPDLLLTDYALPGLDGLTALKLARQRAPELPAIIVSGAIGEETAIEALKAGATDYVLKRRLDRLGPVVRRALQEARQWRERRQAQEQRRLAVKFLRLVNQSTGTGDLVRQATAFFREHSGCQAVGIRLKAGDDYPYLETRGFPAEFVRIESPLCARDQAGNVQRDAAGNPVIECMCGNVIEGRFDPAKPFFTEHGSFWTNSTTELLGDIAESGRQTRMRNHCNREGYESLALLPLRVGDERLGLLQLNDPRKGRFSAELIASWEGLLGYLAIALSKWRAQEALHEGQERLKIAQATRAERQRLYDVLETLPVYVVLLSPDYRVPFANRFFRERFGDSTDRRCYEYLFGRAEPCEVCETFTVLKNAQPHQWYWTGPDGRHYDIHDFPFTDTDGSPLILEMGIDITERKRAEAALRERSEKLRALTAELTLTEQRERQKLARVLHDGLQQLLVGAKFRLAALERVHDPAAHKTAREVDDLLSDAIETSRSLTAELSPPILREGGLVAALEWLARWMRDKHGLTVHLNAQGRMGPVNPDITILLFQATRELLFNVVKHAGVSWARVHVAHLNGSIRVAVADQGVGFEAAQTLTAGSTPGGFGLFSIRERVDLVGGRMEIHSAPGRGSRLTLTVPLAGSPAPSAPGDREAEVSVVITPPPAVLPAGACRVVLVDDHVVVRQGLAGLLQGEENIVVVGEASDGESALAVVRQTRPDVVLMDVSMPGMNGVEATRLIHAEMPEVRVIGLSMFEQADRAADMRAAGAVDYLTKSGPAEALIQAVRARSKPKKRV